MNTNVVKCGATTLIDFGWQVKIVEGDSIDGDFLPKALVKGITIRAIRERVAAMRTAEAEFFRRGDELKAEFPGVSYGYIGNLETGWDDRSYSIFLPHPGRVGTSSDRVGDYHRWELDKALADWDRIKAAVAKGMAGR